MVAALNPGLTQRFLAILRKHEVRFGPRVAGWSYIVVPEGQSFPETTIPDTAKKQVRVRVTMSTLQYPMQAAFQLSHEAVHCLAPTSRRDTIWFEEGLANHVSLTFPEIGENVREENAAKVPTLFVEPLAAFRSLSATDEQIKQMRAEEPCFDKLTPSLIQKYFNTSDELSEKLCRRLPLERPEKM